MAYIDFHPTIHAMGDEACAAAIIEGTITEFEDMSLPDLRIRSLAYCDSLRRFLVNDTTSLFYTYEYNSNLQEAILPRANGIEMRAFQGCGNLKRVLLGSAPSFYHYTFDACASLDTVIIANRKAASLQFSTDVFNKTPIADGTGYIYVPKEMVDGSDGISTYEAATNWSAFAGQFRYIEDYPEILALVKEEVPWY